MTVEIDFVSGVGMMRFQVFCLNQLKNSPTIRTFAFTTILFYRYINLRVGIPQA